MKSSNPFSLEGKNILITGASSGIGQQCAISCNQMGARIILIGRRKEKLIETIGLLPFSNNIYYSFDVTNYQDIGSIIADAATKTGPIHGFIHSAGIEYTLPLSLTKPTHYSELFATNVIAGFEFAKVISKKKYINKEGGSFVFISSVRGFLGEVAQTGYCSSKGALIAGTKALSLELAFKKIRVNCISPAQISGTEMTNKIFENSTEQNNSRKLDMYPLGYGETNDVANGCIFLLSDASKWITGTSLILGGE